MALLKSLIVILTILIGISIGLLGYGLLKQAQDPDWRLFGSSESSKLENKDRPSPTSLTNDLQKIKSWGNVNLNLPSKCQISGVNANGTQLYLTVGPIGECHRVVIIDLKSGQIIGSVKPTP